MMQNERYILLIIKFNGFSSGMPNDYPLIKEMLSILLNSLLEKESSSFPFYKNYSAEKNSFRTCIHKVNVIFFKVSLLQ